MDKQKITPLMQLNCFPEQKWKVIDKKRDLDLAMWYEGKVLYINFEGSDSLRDFVYNLSFFPIKAPYKNMIDKYYTHSGFSKLYHIARDDVHNEVKKHKDLNKIVIMGHSLGAALATLCYADFMWHKENKNYKMKIVGFASGSPRVGYKKGFDNFEKFTKGLIRLKFNNDFITRLPFNFLGYKHVGEEVHFGKKSWWPFTLAAIYHHYRKSYLNHLKNEDHKDDRENNSMYLNGIISTLIINLTIVFGIIYFVWRLF